MSERDDMVYVQHILEAVRWIQDFTRGMSRNDFLADKKTQEAVIRQLQVIGDASKKVNQSFRAKHCQVPWTEAARMRDVLVHNYFGVNLDRVWTTVQRDLPQMASALSDLGKGMA